MGSQEGKEEHHVVLLLDNPFVPPKGDACFINQLPPELLSRIFEAGATDCDSEDEDDTSSYTHYRRLDTNDTDDNDTQDNDTEMTEEPADAEADDEEADEEGDSDTTGPSDLPFPWPAFQVIVSRICRRWRDIAFSTPSLWTTITAGSDARPPYQHVSTLLERSKGLPIDIHVDCEPLEDAESNTTNHGPPSEADLEFLYSLLTPHVHRWRTVEISVSEYSLMYVFLNAVSHPSISSAPQLVTLELYHHEDPEDFDSFRFPSMSKHFIPFGGSVPCLASAVLWGVHVDWGQPWIASASKLRHLELAYHTEDVRPSWVQLASILRGAPDLQELSLRLSGPSGDPPEWFIEPTPGGPSNLNAPIQLLKVTDFIFAFYSQTRAIGLLRKLYLPALKSLVLDFDDGDYTELVDELTGPATSISLPRAQDQPRSLLSNVDYLKIAGLPCNIACVEKIYGELQNLTLLNISLSYLPRLFLNILSTPCTLAGRGNIWLPRLSTLYISGTSGDALREVVDARRDMGVPLDSLYVEESCDLDKEDMEWLKENVNVFDFFEGSDDEDVIDFEDLQEEEVDEWSDTYSESY